MPRSALSESGLPPGVFSQVVIPVKSGAEPQFTKVLAFVLQLVSDVWAAPVSPLSCLRILPEPWSAVVYPGMSRCSPPKTLKAMATAMTMSTAPPARRASGARRRTAPIRRVSWLPATAIARSGTAVPAANAAVRMTAVSPTRCVAPITVMAASTGPAQGTYRTPRARPRTNPPARSLGRRALSRVNGRSISVPTDGMR